MMTQLQQLTPAGNLEIKVRDGDSVCLEFRGEFQIQIWTPNFKYIYSNLCL